MSSPNDRDCIPGRYRAEGLCNARRRALIVLFLLLGGIWSNQSVSETTQGTHADKSKQIRDRDRQRDAKFRSQALDKDRKVWRYVTKKGLDKDKKQGVSAHVHMTSRVHPGRPPSSTTAQKQYGLAKPPVARELLVVPKGQPVRKTKVLGGGRGRGEMTSAKALPKGALKATTLLKQSANRHSGKK